MICGITRHIEGHGCLPGVRRIVGAVEERVGIAIAERVHAVEQVLSPQAPEVAMVEDRVDHRRRVARLDAANVGLSD